MSDKKDDDVDVEFDQTNGLASGLDGDSDGTAASDDESAAERDRFGEGTGEDPLSPVVGDDDPDHGD